MKKRNKVLLMILVLVLGFTMCVSGAAGSTEDPLISLSYITNVLMPYIDDATQNVGGSEYVVVELSAGESLKTGSSTEVIWRSGEGTIVLSSGAAGGYTDVTAGRDIGNGETVSANHLLICPRADGRSIRAKTKAYMMVRGYYEIG